MESNFLYLIIGLALGVGLSVLFFKPRLKKLLHLSKTDDLTGIRNYRDFNDFIQNIDKHTSRRMRPLCLVLIDLDNFKHINDKQGYAQGDLVLKAFATYLRSLLRENDLLFRYKQGDEFALIIEAAPSALKSIMKRIQSNNSSLPRFSYAYGVIEKNNPQQSIQNVELKLRNSKAKKQK